MFQGLKIRFQHWVMLSTTLLVATLAAIFLITVFRTFTSISEENATTRFSLIAGQAASQLEGLLHQNRKFIVAAGHVASRAFVIGTVPAGRPDQPEKPRARHLSARSKRIRRSTRILSGWRTKNSCRSSAFAANHASSPRCRRRPRPTMRCGAYPAGQPGHPYRLLPVSRSRAASDRRARPGSQTAAHPASLVRQVDGTE